jgi:hypothetical protein
MKQTKIIIFSIFSEMLFLFDKFDKNHELRG